MNPKLRLFHHLNIYIFTFILLIIGGSIANFATQSLPKTTLRYALLAMFGLVTGFVVYKSIQWSLAALNKKPMAMGNAKTFLLGIFTGIAISIVCGLGFGWYYGYHIDTSQLNYIHYSTLSNISPAVVEELVFRAGIVNLVAQVAGTFAGLAAGSVPFGVIHFISIFFGQIVTVSQVVGATVAGLMLSLVYLRWGLLAAIGIHWAWNSLSWMWVKGYGLGNDGMSAFEGSWVTIIVLGLACAFLLRINRPAD